jgi:hypothetical protein
MSYQSNQPISLAVITPEADLTEEHRSDYSASSEHEVDILHSPGTVINAQASLSRITINNLIEQTSLAVIGLYNGKSEVLLIQSVIHGGLRVYTDYYLDVISTVRGETKSETVAVRVMGGVIGEYSHTYTPSAIFVEGDTYLVFLMQPNMGSNFNTECNFYYLVGNIQGIFTRDGERFVSQSQSNTFDEYALSKLNDMPINRYWYREHYVSMLERRLADARLSEEQWAIETTELIEHEIKSIDTFAEIIAREWR